MPDQNCRELLAQLSDYIDGELDPMLCRALEQHVDGCIDCRTVVKTLAQTVALYQSLPQADLVPDTATRLCAVLGLDAQA